MSVAFGATSGLLCHFWYAFLDRAVPGGACLRAVGKKVLADQIAFSPVCIAACLTASAGADGKTGARLVNEVKVKGEFFAMLSLKALRDRSDYCTN